MSVASELLTLAHELGKPERGLVILGEGNASARLNETSFCISASGSSLATLQDAEVTAVNLATILSALEEQALGEEAVEEVLYASRCAEGSQKPSVETFVHAVCLKAGANWIGHTHTLSVNWFLCTEQGSQAFTRHILPDAVVVCGVRPLWVPYADPGFALAKAVSHALDGYLQREQRLPKLILLANHGPIALGETAKEALSIMLMLDKWARMLQGAMSIGEVRYLPEEEVARIDARLDEKLRREKIFGRRV